MYIKIVQRLYACFLEENNTEQTERDDQKSLTFSRIPYRTYVYTNIAIHNGIAFY